MEDPTWGKDIQFIIIASEFYSDGAWHRVPQSANVPKSGNIKFKFIP